jgi:pimeloyl-ACP methyl ester carboxylesterase
MNFYSTFCFVISNNDGNDRNNNNNNKRQDMGDLAVVVNIDDAIKSLDCHIERLEAKILYLIRSTLTSLDVSNIINNINDDDNNNNEYYCIFVDLFHKVRRQIITIEEDIIFARRLKRNFESLRHQSVRSYWSAENYISINNNLIRYLAYGPSDSNKVLVLIHGLGACAERWCPIIPTLLSAEKTKGYRVIIPDIIGFGYSDKPRDADYTMDFFINDFLTPFLDNLGISKATIVGSSFGGHIATEFAIRFNHRVEKLVLVSPTGMMRQSNPTLESYARAASNPKYRLVYEAFREMVYDNRVVTQKMVRDFMNKMSLPNAVHAFMSTLYNIKYAPDLRTRLSNITAPTLIVWGDNDNMTPLADNAYQFNGIPNMIMERLLVVIKKCGHLVPLEKPVMFGKIVVRCI